MGYANISNNTVNVLFLTATLQRRNTLGKFI